jgi:hypothetical protein
MQAMVSTFNSEDLKMRRRAQIKLGLRAARLHSSRRRIVGRVDGGNVGHCIDQRTFRGALLVGVMVV